MLKKLLSASAFSLFIIAPGFAQDVSVTVQVPLDNSATAVAAKEATLMQAAEKVCSKVKYAGVLSFYAATARQDCIKETYAKALAEADAAEVVAKLDTKKQ